MSKKVELIIEIDSSGKISVTPKGTVGKECIELMAFLDKIDGVEVITTDILDLKSETKEVVIEKIIQKH